MNDEILNKAVKIKKDLSTLDTLIDDFSKISDKHARLSQTIDGKKAKDNWFTEIAGSLNFFSVPKKSDEDEAKGDKMVVHSGRDYYSDKRIVVEFDSIYNEELHHEMAILKIKIVDYALRQLVMIRNKGRKSFKEL